MTYKNYSDLASWSQSEGIFREIQNSINFDFEFDRVVKKILDNIEKITNCKGIALSEVDLSQNKNILFKSPRLERMDYEKRMPVFSYPVVLINNIIAYTLDIYSIEGGALPTRDNENLGIFVELLTQAVNKEAIKKDSLTGLYSREHFDSQFEMELINASQNEERVALFMIDIDHFKKVNDTYGHPVGDLVLKKVSFTISNITKKNGLVARYGGEEIVVLMRDIGEERAKKFAESFRQDIENMKINHNGEEISVTISIGVSIYPEDATDADSLLEMADSALYRAKNSGRNQVQFYSRTDSITIDDKVFEEINIQREEPKKKRVLLQQIVNITPIITTRFIKSSINPVAVFVDDERDNIYLLDKLLSTIYCFALDGALIHKFGEVGEGTGAKMSEPQDLYVDGGGNIWVVDSGNHALKKFNSAGFPEKTISNMDESENPIPGLGMGSFSLPYAIIGYDDAIMVAERHNRRIQSFNLKGDFIEEITIPQFSREGFTRPDPIDLCVDSSESLYIVDFANNAIIILDKNRDVLGKIGGVGKEPGMFSGLYSIACGRMNLKDYIPDFPEEVVITAEMGDVNRLQFFDTEGQFLDLIDLSVYSTDFGNTRPMDLYLSDNGKIYLITQDEVNILIEIDMKLPSSTDVD